MRSLTDDGNISPITHTGTCAVSSPPQLLEQPIWHGFKLVGDNIDKNVRRRHQTIDRSTQSLHYFNTFAVEDRIDFSGLSELRPNISLNDMSPEQLLPSHDDLSNLLANLGVLVSHILTEHLPAMKHLAPAVDKHIKHKYYSQMSKASVVVSYVRLMNRQLNLITTP